MSVPSFTHRRCTAMRKRSQRRPSWSYPPCRHFDLHSGSCASYCSHRSQHYRTEPGSESARLVLLPAAGGKPGTAALPREAERAVIDAPPFREKYEVRKNATTLRIVSGMLSDASWDVFGDHKAELASETGTVKAMHTQ